VSDHTFVYFAGGRETHEPRGASRLRQQAIAEIALPHISLRDHRHGIEMPFLHRAFIRRSRANGSGIRAMILDVYSQVRPGMQEDAANRVDGALRAALDRRRDSRG
jgi:hypothetical protein